VGAGPLELLLAMEVPEQAAQSPGLQLLSVVVLVRGLALLGVPEVPEVAQVGVLLGPVVPVPLDRVTMVEVLLHLFLTQPAVAAVLRLLVGVELAPPLAVEALALPHQSQALQSHALAVAVVGRYTTLLQRRGVPAAGVTVVLTQQLQHRLQLIQVLVAAEEVPTVLVPAVQAALELSLSPCQLPAIAVSQLAHQRSRPAVRTQLCNSIHREVTQHDHPLKHHPSSKRIDGFRHTACEQRWYRLNFTGHCW
jgi:hypothetical protein